MYRKDQSSENARASSLASASSGSPRKLLEERACSLCSGQPKFHLPEEFLDHLRQVHSTKEGGSFICRFGAHNFCQSLPLEGVSDRDYEEHIRKTHLMACSGDASHFNAVNSEDSSQSSPVRGLLAPETPSLVRDAQHTSFTVYSSTQNLSSVLADPHKSRREIAAFFTRHWGDYFVEKTQIPASYLLPRIGALHFDSYLSTVGKKHKRHVRDSRHMAALARRHLCESPSSTTTKETTPSGVLEYERIKPNLTEIPKVFLYSKFNLEEPLTFETVFLRLTQEAEPKPEASNNPFAADMQDSASDVDSAKNPFAEDMDQADVMMPQPQKLRPSKLLQEKLAYYMDIVEGQIGRQIASKSGAFFKAMTSHDELQTYLAQTKYAVQRLRDKIANIDSTLVQKSYRLLSLQQARENKSRLLEKLRLIATVKETQPTVQMLLNSYDFLGALDVIATTQDVLKEELNGIISFRHLSLQLSEIQNVISKMLQEEFVKYLQTELNRPLLADAHILEEQHLTSIVLGLLRVREFRFCPVLKTEMSSAVTNLNRSSIKEQLLEQDSSVTDFDPSVGSLGAQVRKLDFGQWMDLITSVFEVLLRFCTKIQMMQDILVDLVDIAAGRCLPLNSPSSKNLPEAQHLHATVSAEMEGILEETDYLQLREDLAELSLHACKVAQERALTVIKARTKENFVERLTADEFHTFVHSIETFINACDSICGAKKVLILRSSVQTLAGRFASRFHEDRKAKLGNILDSELWRAAEVPSVFQDIVDSCASSGYLRDAHQGGIDSPPPSRGDVPRPSLVVDGEEFAVVGTALLLLRMVAQYCETVNTTPCLAAELLTRLVELLKNFNSRTCQLILGAGALQLVGLKTISAKNLALASRCLQLIVKYIPVAQRQFLETLPPNQNHVTRHFSQVLKDYNDHIQEISNKLLSVMDHHLCSSLKKWDLQRGSSPSTCFVQIVKHVRKFHESLVGILPPDQIQVLFLRIHDNFKLALQEILSSHNVEANERYAFIDQEFSHYMKGMRALPCCSGLSDTLRDVLAMK